MATVKTKDEKNERLEKINAILKDKSKIEVSINVNINDDPEPINPDSMSSRSSSSRMIVVTIPKENNEIFYSLRNFFAVDTDKQPVRFTFQSYTYERKPYKAFFIRMISDVSFDMGSINQMFLLDEVVIPVPSVREVRRVQNDIGRFVQVLFDAISVISLKKDLKVNITIV